MDEMTKSLIDKIKTNVYQSKTICENGNHWFIPYNKGNVICKKCGRFAKVGYMYKEKENDRST